MNDEPVRDALARFLALEKTLSAEELERRRQYRSPHAGEDALARFERYQANKNVAPDSKPKPSYDPWENVLRGVETRSGVMTVVNRNGDLEYRVRTRYLLTSVIGLAPERTNGSSQGSRLGAIMRRLGWSGPQELRVGKDHFKGYFKVKP